jgi:hypothetical protein
VRRGTPTRPFPGAVVTQRGLHRSGLRKTLSTATLAPAGFGGAGPALAQPTAAPMQPGQRVQLGPMMGERVVREMMVSQGGGGLAVVYDAAPGQPQSQRVLRLENVMACSR